MTERWAVKRTDFGVTSFMNSPRTTNNEWVTLLTCDELPTINEIIVSLIGKIYLMLPLYFLIFSFRRDNVGLKFFITKISHHHHQRCMLCQTKQKSKNFPLYFFYIKAIKYNPPHEVKNLFQIPLNHF